MPERKIVYEKLAHKADMGFKVEAPSLERLFIDSALALTDLLIPMDLIQAQEKKVVKVSAEDKEKLLVRWLNEILFLFEKEKFLSRRIVFEKFDGKTISATLFGEKYVPTRHGSTSEIKAVTFHQLQIGQADVPEMHFFAQVYLDL